MCWGLGGQGRHTEVIEQLCVVCFLCWPLHSFQWLSSGHPLAYPHTHRYVYIYICMYSCSIYSCILVQYSINSYCLKFYLFIIFKSFSSFVYIFITTYPSVHPWQYWKIKFEFFCSRTLPFFQELHVLSLAFLSAQYKYFKQ